MGGRPAELLRCLALFAEPPGPEHVRVAELLELPAVPDNAAYSDVFLFHLYPYAAVYLGEEGMMGGEAANRIGGFWSAVGRVPPREVDHLAALLSLYADLIDDSQTGATPGASPGAAVDPAEQRLRQEAASALLNEHLTPWVFGYLARIRELSGDSFYGAWAKLLAEVLRGEVEALSGPAELSAHLRAAPELSDPRSSKASDFLAGLLAPVRSGIILTRADLGRMAKELDLGLRAGERRYALEHLLGARPGAVLGWIAREAIRQSAAQSERAEWVGESARFMSARASRAAELCLELAQVSEDPESAG